MKITVVIITKDRPFQLKNALDSLSAQTRKADEVVVVENRAGASREVCRIIEECKPKLNIYFVLEPCIGIPLARNAGVRAATGDIIAFLDDDCVADSNWLKTLETPFLRDKTIGMVGGGLTHGNEARTFVEKFLNSSVAVGNGQNVII